MDTPMSTTMASEDQTARADQAATALVQGNVKLVSLPHVCIRVNMMV